eukprot:CAMPEP_0179138676 /NCGR_PEP_ID=MMETSP0796-20121207/66249_1 /TAXON_ID=73915 /ORGANISM="Pyrodinium bahamense, Strain pbaha01" /LENGTH=137 /DNA_ID=CAMNT_0020837987 /DNA_START=128 /DNA_END=537 /DNA_ORIENTATION=+
MMQTVVERVVPAALEPPVAVGTVAANGRDKQEHGSHKDSAEDTFSVQGFDDAAQHGVTPTTSDGSDASSKASAEAAEAAGEPTGAAAAAALGGGLANGFSTIPEPETIRVRDANVAPYSLPQEALTYEPDASAVVTR